MNLPGMRLTLRRLTFCAVYAPIHSLLGRFAFARRAYDAARSHFECILDVHPDHFSAHVFLARIHLMADEEREAIRELREARRIDPARFERLGLEAEFLEAAVPSADDPFDPSFDDAGLLPSAWPAGDAPVAPRSSGPLGDETETRRGAPRGRRIARSRRDPFPIGTPGGFGDFSGPEEFARFRHLPPLKREDVERIDWERLDSRAFD